MISQCPGNVFIGARASVYNCQSDFRLTPRRLAFLSRPSATRHLGILSRSTACLQASTGHGALCASPSATDARRQSYATASKKNHEPRQIAVLGAGITGLTAAHYLARHAKNAHITIYEASDRPGGWIKADRVEVEDEEGRRGHVLFQRGPRVLRSGSTSSKYDDLVLYDVLASLGLDHKIRHPKTASDSRYLYYPDHLVKMPSLEPSVENVVGTIRSVLTEPIFSGLFRGAYNFLASRFHASPSPDNVRRPDESIGQFIGRVNMGLSKAHRAGVSTQVPEDESVAQFLTRVMKDDRIVNNIVSGVMHGIYGGDVHKLSVKHTMLERMWCHFKNPLPRDQNYFWRDRTERYLLWDMLSGPQRLKIIELAEGAVDWKLLAFEDGLVSLVDGLVKDLKSRKNVTFKLNSRVKSLKHIDGKVSRFDHVICTLLSKQLAQITEPKNSLPSLEETHAVTIMVVNLWYPNPNLLDIGGFGYLVPSSTPDNDECVLGVLFDSDLRTDDDDSSEMPGTKLTVMLGGHYWDGWEHLPSEEMGVAMAKEVLQRHLGISTAEKVVASARLCRECLPQHFVGHRDRMKEAHYELLSTFQGHLTVAGPSYTSIGVIPAMRAGYYAAMRVARGHKQPWFRIPEDRRFGGPCAGPEYDYWQALRISQSHTVTDVVGASGLEQFTEDEWLSREIFLPQEGLFRKFSMPQVRFRDEEGRFLGADDRVIKNVPPFIQAQLLSWQKETQKRRGDTPE